MKRYSPTKISTFEACPQRYKFRYIDRIRREEENIEAFMGKRAHETLVKLYKDLLLSKENSLKQILAHYRNRWKKNWHPGVRIVKEEFSEENYLLTGERCIRDYYKRYFPFDQGRTIGLELKVEMPLNTTGCFLIGFIDRLVYLGEGKFEIHDYKTSTTFPDQAKIDQDRQLPLYQIAVEGMWKDVREVRLVWHFLAFDKEIISTRSAEDLESLKGHIKGVVESIENTTNFLPVESPLCKWCEYRSLCPLWKHLFKVEALPVEEGLKEDGVSLVNHFISLMEKKRALNDVLQTTKEAIAHFAEKEGVDVLFGTDHKLRIKREKRLKFPSLSDDPVKRAQLEEWLKRTKKWLEVSKLDLNALEKALEKGAWKDKLLTRLKEYVTSEEHIYFYPSRLKEEE